MHYRDDHDVQQVCRNGHVITALLKTFPATGQKFCDKCGESTICACEFCHTPMKGADLVAMALDVFYKVPRFAHSYCSACGKPYPWTQKRMDAAMDAAREVDGIDESELNLLGTSLHELGRDTPQSDVAIIRWKKFLAKAGGTVGPILTKLISEIATSEIKRKMGLN
jgi:hypothetical protein